MGKDPAVQFKKQHKQKSAGQNQRCLLNEVMNAAGHATVF
jgi:D-alanyl-D-alanine dipeptidase